MAADNEVLRYLEQLEQRMRTSEIVEAGPALGELIGDYLGLSQLAGFWPLSSVDENGRAIDLGGQHRNMFSGAYPAMGITAYGAPYATFNGSSQYLTWTATHFKDLLNSLIGQKLESPSSRITQNTAEGSVTFANNTDLTDYVVVVFQINHDWKLGTTVFPHLHWWQTTASIPNWLIQHRWQKQGSAKTTSWTSAKWTSSAFTWSSGTLNQITDFGGVTPPAGYSMSDILQIRLLRDKANGSGLFSGSDGLAATVDAVNLDVHYEVDSDGSDTEYSK